MTHVYATVDEFKSYLTDNTSGLTAGLDDEILALLEGASRRVDAYCDRSQFGSGFGPRVATNRYDGDGTNTLWLNDDLLAITTVTAYDATASSTSVVPAADTDYYTFPYDTTPYRHLRLHGAGTVTAFTRGLRTVTVAGTAGYQSTTSTLGTAGTATSSATSLTLSGSPSAGMTLLVGTEHLYITAVSGGTATVTRAQNGTTAAVISAGASVSYFTYPAAVKAATLAVAGRRWRSRDAGLTGDMGIPSVTGSVQPRDTEMSVLRTHVGHLKVWSAG